jgi:2,3,4,5-tetrahydropyridine-2-carboxylate N-succinyltransferase
MAVNMNVKKVVRMYQSKKMETWESGIFEHHDKTLKETMPKRNLRSTKCRSAPWSRDSRCTRLPSYVNIAYVDEGTMVDNTGRKLCLELVQKRSLKVVV